jgi:hypothetical protein
MLWAHPSFIEVMNHEFTCQLVVQEPAQTEEHIDQERELKDGERHKHRPTGRKFPTPGPCNDTCDDTRCERDEAAKHSDSVFGGWERHWIDCQ